MWWDWPAGGRDRGMLDVEMDEGGLGGKVEAADKEWRKDMQWREEKEGGKVGVEGGGLNGSVQRK